MPDTVSRGGPRTDSATSRIALADAAPGLRAFLAADERFVLEQISVPLVHVSNGSVPVGELLERRGAFGAIVVEGLVLNELAIGDEPALWILGPGDVIAATDGWGPTIAARSGYRARASTRLALLAGDFMTAVRREPRVLVGLQAAAAEQLERVVTQLAICQMPRVADRVHAMLWLLADSFGRVGTAGTRVPLSLTHEIIGGLVGARRPTVTLALGELSKRGAVVQQDGGWLLLEPFEPQHTETKHRLEEPKLLDLEPSEWAVREGPVLEPSIALEALVDTVGRLREEHRVRVQQVTDRLARVRRSRERTSEVLRRVRAGRGVSSRLPPST